MSASSKKKLRKEQASAALTEKQRAARKEERQLKAYTISFISIMLVIVITAVSVISVTGINRTGFFQKRTIAATVGSHEINSVEMSYFFKDAVTTAYADWKESYGSNTDFYVQWFYQLDVNQPLNKQTYSEGITWADHFLNSALSNAKSNYILYDLAMQNGHTLTEDERENFELQMTYLDLEALYSGFTTDEYLEYIYCYGASRESYYRYTEILAYARSYYAKYYNDLTYTNEQLRAHEEGKYNDYSSFTYGRYYLNYKNYLNTEDKDESGNYSDEKIAEAKAKALADAQLLAQSTGKEALAEAIKNLAINKENPNAAITEDKGVIFTNLTPEYKEWLGDKERVEGDVAYFEDTTTSKDENGEEVVTGEGCYYVVIFFSRNDNLRMLANVRHLLIKFQGGSEDESGNTVYSDEEKAAAKTKAQELLDKFLADNAEVTDLTKLEENFAALVTEKTEDTGSKATGGLYEDITPDSNYVENFLNWAIDDTRKQGDIDLVETEYGYHIMYYVGDGDINYRDYIIRSELRTEDMTKWMEEIQSPVVASLKKLKYVPMSVTVYSIVNSSGLIY